MDTIETLTATDLKAYSKEDYRLIFDYITKRDDKLRITIKENNMSRIVAQILRLSKFYDIWRDDPHFELKLFAKLNRSDNLAHIWIWNIVYNIINWKRNCNNCAVAERFNSLREEATTDHLTWLLNRRGFETELIKNIKIKNRKGTDSAILMIDIDHFKRINDTYWHKIWDEVLKELSKIFQDTFRNDDVLARWWWEEFIMILPWINIDIAKKRAEALLLFVKDNLSKKITDIEGDITISIWISMIDKWEETWTHVIQRADVALYEAKKTWRNRVECI